MARLLTDLRRGGGADAPADASSGGVRAARWSPIPVVLVVVLLLGSVLIPARQTWRILHLLQETTDVIEPARLHGARLESGLIVESAALEGFALSGDAVQLARYRAAAADDNRQLAALEGLAGRLDAEAIERTAALRRRVDEWREASRALVEGGVPRAQLSGAMRAQEASYEAALRQVTRLAAYLTAEETARRNLIGGSEQLGLLVNASLVLVALAAVLAVGALSYRERRLTGILRRRIEEEAALGRVAQELGAAETAEAVLRRLAEGTAATTRAAGAYVECGEPEGDTVDSVLKLGEDSDARYQRGPRAGSLTEALSARGGADALARADTILGRALPGLVGGGTARQAGLLVPLSPFGHGLGTLVVLRDSASAPFGEDARRQTNTLADLASAALQRVMVQAAERRALEEARRRAKQEVALREAAEALAAAFTVDEVTRQIARTALGAMPARGAFVEEIVAAAGEEADRVVVRAAAGAGVPAVESAAPFAGSYMERVLEAREPVLIPDVVRAERPCMAAATAESGCSAIVVPLGNAAAPIGALFVVSDSRTPFTPDHLTRADTFGHLAALAYEKVRLLDEAREGRAELERVMSSRSRLMRGFSHDVKNPLGAADGYAALLSDGIFGALDAPQAAGIERIRGCIHTALGLIDDLHELARAETGNLVLSPEPLELRDLARTTGEEYRAAAEAAGLSLSVEVTREPLVVETDRARVRQVVSNLLSNAIKYTDEGSVTLRTRREPPDDAGETGGWAAIDVSDTGRGIPPGKLDVIFDEFTRVGTDDRPGAGLGLAISQKLAQAMGGRISVRSEVGRGSTFTLRLPFPGPGGPATPAAQGSMAGAPSGTLAP